MAKNALVDGKTDAKYRTIYRPRRKEDEDLMGVPWPNYMGAAGSGGSSGMGGGGGLGNAGGIAAPGGFGASSNSLVAPQGQPSLDQGSDGGGNAEGPAMGEPGTLEDALTGFLAVNPLGPLSLMSFIGLSEKEKAQEDINLGLETDRARIGRALGMAPTKDPYSYNPSDASGFTEQAGAPPGPTSPEVNAGLEPAQSTPTTAAQNFGETSPYGPVGNPGQPQGGENAAGGGYTGGYGDNEGRGGGPGAPDGGGGLGVGSDPGQAGNTGGASSESPGHYHQGGIIPSDGDAYAEDVPITALEGEGVLRPEAVEMLGPDFIDITNALAALVGKRRNRNALVG